MCFALQGLKTFLIVMTEVILLGDSSRGQEYCKIFYNAQGRPTTTKIIQPHMSAVLGVENLWIIVCSKGQEILHNYFSRGQKFISIL